MSLHCLSQYDSRGQSQGHSYNDKVVRARLEGLGLVTLPLCKYGISTVAQTVAISQERLALDPDLAHWIAYDLLAELESSEGLCTASVLEEAWEEE